MLDPLAVLRELIQRPSLTPQDAGCQVFLREQLERLGFVCTALRFGEVDNLWAKRGTEGPLLVFAGHTDVVPPGEVSAWATDPFTPSERDGMIYGRGAADMKGGLAAMLVACERFLADYPQHQGSLAWLITSDEEGPAINGTRQVVEWLTAQGIVMDWCVVGEPSSRVTVGDEIKNGRRGSLNGFLTIHGTQGHVAYPHLAANPIHQFAPLMYELGSYVWDHGNAHFPPTGFQIVQLQAGNQVTNVIPGQLTCWFNFRYSTEVTAEILQNRFIALLNKHNLHYDLRWEHSGLPFLTEQGPLLSAACQAVQEITGTSCQLSTSGGTSDGRFIAPTGAQVLELGLINATIHKVNEGINIADLQMLSFIYQRMLELLLVERAHD